MDSVNIGIIGTGVGVRTLIPGFRTVKGANILAICGRTTERAQEFARKLDIPHAFGDVRELCRLQELDLVCVASPNPFHHDQVIETIRHGKHVLCEKPLANTLREIESMTKAASSTNKICVLDHQLRFSPYFLKVKSILSSGGLGRPYFVRFHQQSTGFADRNAQWNWSFEEEQGGGVRLAMGSHFLDLLQFWFGLGVLNARGAMDSVVRLRKDASGAQREVHAAGFFTGALALEGGVDVQLSATAASCGVSRFDLSIYGTDGELHFDLENKLRAAFLDRRGQVEPVKIEGVFQDELENKASFFAGSFRYFAPRLVKAIATGDVTPINEAATFRDAIPTHHALEALRKSALEGRSVELSKGYAPGARV